MCLIIYIFFLLKENCNFRPPSVRKKIYDYTIGVQMILIASLSLALYDVVRELSESPVFPENSARVDDMMLQGSDTHWIQPVLRISKQKNVRRNI